MSSPRTEHERLQEIAVQYQAIWQKVLGGITAEHPPEWLWAANTGAGTWSVLTESEIRNEMLGWGRPPFHRGILRQQHDGGTELFFEKFGAEFHPRGKLSEKLELTTLYECDNRIFTMGTWDLSKLIRERLKNFEQCVLIPRQQLSEQIAELEKRKQELEQTAKDLEWT